MFNLLPDIAIMTLILKGSYRDILTDSISKVVWTSGWRSNLIVHNCYVLLAALMKGQPDLKGLMYLAAGKGRDSWDSTRPETVPTATMLEQEVLRKPITDAQISYSGRPDQIPTSRLEITVSLHGADVAPGGSVPLREFGLFGGDATDVTNSGYLINHVIHPRIDLTPQLTLVRRMHLEFSEGTVRIKIPGREGKGFGASLPVIGISGIGSSYAEILHEQGIRTLGDLVTLDPSTAAGKISTARLKEFQVKSKLVMNMQLSLTPFRQLTGWSIDRLVSESPEVLVRASPGITREMAEQFQEELSILQVSLDEVLLHELTLGDLVSA